MDGWDKETGTMFQFHGYYWHGNDCKLGIRRPEEERLHKRSGTELMAKYFVRSGYKLVEMWECEWNMLKHADTLAVEVLKELTQPIPGGGGNTTLKEKDILRLVRQGTLFGMVQCDLHVPEPLREYFAEMQPIFKNTNMSREHLSPLMRRYAEEHDVLKQPRRTLVGSY